MRPFPSPDGDNQTDSEAAINTGFQGPLFKINFAHMATGGDMGVTQASDVWVRLGTEYLGGALVGGGTMPMPASMFTTGGDMGPLHKKEVQAQRSAEDEKHYEALLQEMPWLAHLETLQAPDSAGEAALKKLRSDAGAGEANEPIDDEIAWEAVAQMEKARADWVIPAVERALEFASFHRGGSRHLLKTGQAQDAVQAANTSDVGKDFCKRRSMQRTFKATFSEHDSEASMILCRALSHRMNFFFWSRNPLIQRM